MNILFDAQLLKDLCVFKLKSGIDSVSPPQFVVISSFSVVHNSTHPILLHPTVSYRDTLLFYLHPILLSNTQPYGSTAHPIEQQSTLLSYILSY